MNYRVTHLRPFGLLIEPKGQRNNIKDLNIESLRKLFWQEGLLLFRGFETFSNANNFSHYCESWGEVCLWPFGKVLELVEHDKPKDHIFDNSYVPLHWDGMYRQQIPEYQIFHCVKAPLKGEGGRTIFSNTLLALKHTTSQLKEDWEKITGCYQREMEFYNSKTRSPIVTKHPLRDFSVIRYNEPPTKNKESFINPPLIEFSGVEKSEVGLFQRQLKKALYDSRNFYAHEWESGDVVIADNFSLLHGREKFMSKSPRHIQRVQALSNPPVDNSALESYS